MVKEDIKIHREVIKKQHGYRVYIKHSNNNRSFTDCMKEVIKTTTDKSIL